MPLFVAVVPPEWHMWRVQPPKNFLLASLAVIFVPPTLEIVAPPLALWRKCTVNVSACQKAMAGKTTNDDKLCKKVV